MDAIVIKLNPDGSPVWARTFGGTSDEYASSIIQTSDGGFAVAGRTRSFGAGNYDMLVLKLSQDGSVNWARTFGGTQNDYANSIIQTADGGLAVCGTTTSFGAGNEDVIVLKLEPDGILSWAKTFGGNRHDVGRDIIQTEDGGYAIAGRAYSFGGGLGSYFVIKLSSSGTMEWSSCPSVNSRYDEGFSIIQTADGGYVVGGHYGDPNWDVLIIKFDSYGSIVWAMTFGGAGINYGNSLIQTGDGELAIAGCTSSFGAGGLDVSVLKLNQDGSPVWARTFGGTDTDWSCSINQTTDGAYVIAGYTRSFGAGGNDILVLKIDSSGNYPGCVQDYSPSATNVSPSAPAPSVGVECYPSTGIPDLVITNPNLTITDGCSPVNLSDNSLNGPRPHIICSAIPGAALFVSSEDMEIKIYSADGRVAYSGELKKGENRITLGQGVYLWQAGPYRGKAAVR